MITIFCDFPQFSAKIGVFLKYQCYDQIISKFGFVLSQNAIFSAKFFGENILKITTSVLHYSCNGVTRCTTPSFRRDLRNELLNLPPRKLMKRGSVPTLLLLPEVRTSAHSSPVS
jgi:hypothetical protein